MIDIVKKGIFSIFLVFFLISLSSSTELSFSEAGTKYLNISVSYSDLDDFSFIVTGLNYSNSYPSNISIDIGNDGIIDWEYKVFNSTLNQPLNSLLNAWSNNIGSAKFNFRNMNSGPILSMFNFGSINSSNIFADNGGNTRENSVLGIDTSTSFSLNSQIITIQTNDTTIHAFLPSISIPGATAGFYVAQGGSTYYCSTYHNDLWDPECDLSPTNAMVLEHLAREADSIYFNYSEVVRNSHATKTINNILQSCSIPCNITIKISVGSPGVMDIDNLTFSPKAAPSYFSSNISLSENSTDYIITIQNSTSLTNTNYFYGAKPTVYVIPFEAMDENRTLSIAQENRLSNIQNNLSKAWGNLTNYSHPLNFVFYTNISPYKIYDFYKGNDYSKYRYSILHYPPVQMEYPAIILMLDIWDYFPDEYPISHLNRPSGYISGGIMDRIISEIYINGLNNASAASLENYDSEIMMNVILHELTHTFLGYPTDTINNQKMFYTYHPANFRNDSDFPEVYAPSLSPTGKEGYFDIYSIINNVRIYIESSQLGNKIIQLSLLDKMLLGILSPDLGGNYTFFSGNITKQGNKYIATNMIANKTYDLKMIYPYTSDDWWWDVRTDSQIVDMGINNSFVVSKQNQNNRALWVFAKDSSNPNHFKVFNNNANSNLSQVYNSKPNITIISPINTTIYPSSPIYLSLNSSSELRACSFWQVPSLSEGTSITLNQSNKSAYYSFNAQEGYNNFTFRCSNMGETNGFASIKNVIVDLTSPIINISITDNPFYLNGSIFSINVSIFDLTFKNISYTLCNSSFCNTTYYNELKNETFTLLLNGLYTYNVTACDKANHCSTTSTLNVMKGAECNFILDLLEWNMSETTNIFFMNLTQLNSVSALEFVNSFGAIAFNQNVNLSGTCGRDMKNQIKVSKHSITINSSLFPELNKSAELAFSEVVMRNPLLKRDGFECSSDICFDRIYNSTSQIYKTNVSSFSTYSLIDQCSDGIQNGGEIEIDCGGSICDVCIPEETCSDGIQNQDETGIDCGGLTCNTCPINNPPNSNAGGGGGGGSEWALSGTTKNITMTENYSNIVANHFINNESRNKTDNSDNLEENNKESSINSSSSLSGKLISDITSLEKETVIPIIIIIFLLIILISSRNRIVYIADKLKTKYGASRKEDKCNREIISNMEDVFENMVNENIIYGDIINENIIDDEVFEEKDINDKHNNGSNVNDGIIDEKGINENDVTRKSFDENSVK